MSKRADNIFVNFNQSAKPASLNAVVTLHWETLHLHPDSHPNRIFCSSGLAAALYARYRRTDDKTNLDEAISLLGEAVERVPESDSYRKDLRSDLSALLAPDSS